MFIYYNEKKKRRNDAFYYSDGQQQTRKADLNSRSERKSLGNENYLRPIRTDYYYYYVLVLTLK